MAEGERADIAVKVSEEYALNKASEEEQPAKFKYFLADEKIRVVYHRTKGRLFQSHCEFKKLKNEGAASLDSSYYDVSVVRLIGLLTLNAF